MSPPILARATTDDFDHEPRSYHDLLTLAARYARDVLAGLAVTNHPTQLAITLGPADLKAATKPGTPAVLLLAIPALPAMLSNGRYVRTVADRQRRPGVRRLHLFGATVEVDGRPLEVLLVVRENFHSQCFFDRMTERSAPPLHRQDGGDVPDGNADSVSAGTNPAAPELDIFVGGAGDATYHNVANYKNTFAKDHNRNVAYFSWTDMDGMLNAIRAAPPGTKVNVIGHSYGAHTAALGIGMMAPTGIHVDKLITIDPVGRSVVPNTLRGAVNTWINVSSAPSDPNRSDFIATLGGSGGHLPTDQADLNYNVDTNHAEFGTMMRTPGPSGVSPEQILLNGGLPQQLNPRLNDPFGGV